MHAPRAAKPNAPNDIPTPNPIAVLLSRAVCGGKLGVCNKVAVMAEVRVDGWVETLEGTDVVDVDVDASEIVVREGTAEEGIKLEVVITRIELVRVSKTVIGWAVVKTLPSAGLLATERPIEP